MTFTLLFEKRLILYITGEIKVSVIYNTFFQMYVVSLFSWIKLLNDTAACSVTKVI